MIAWLSTLCVLWLFCFCICTVAKMQSSQVSFMAIALLCLLGQEVYGQMPTACSDATSLENLECCPATSDGVCGQFNSIQLIFFQLLAL